MQAWHHFVAAPPAAPTHAAEHAIAARGITLLLAAPMFSPVPPAQACTKASTPCAAGLVPCVPLGQMVCCGFRHVYTIPLIFAIESMWVALFVRARASARVPHLLRGTCHGLCCGPCVALDLMPAWPKGGAVNSRSLAVAHGLQGSRASICQSKVFNQPKVFRGSARALTFPPPGCDVCAAALHPLPSPPRFAPRGTARGKHARLHCKQPARCPLHACKRRLAAAAGLQTQGRPHQALVPHLPELLSAVSVLRPELIMRPKKPARFRRSGGHCDARADVGPGEGA